MIKKLILTFVLLFSVTFRVSPQNTDSLYNKLLQLRNGSFSGSKLGAGQLASEPVKCAFGLFASVKSNFDKFTKKQQNEIQQILQRPLADTSIVSPSGLFRIHYFFDNTNKPGYDLNELALALDSSYNFEVNFLGYPPPPSDNNAGGDDKYDVYVLNLSGGLYGYTEPETQVTNLTSTSFMVMDNDFSNYYTTGINAAKVTAAHEFHHAIQLGNYIYRDEDVWYYELTSTSMEEFVYDEINDYYAYMKSYFNRPYNTISAHSGYDMAVWNIFLVERFANINNMLGFDIIKRSWELMIDNRAVVAIAKAIQEKGYSFKQEFNTFGLWIFFTGYRTKAGQYFDEAANYPLVQPTTTIEFVPPKKEVMINSEPISNNYIVFPDFSKGFNDTLVSIISNTDIEGAADPQNNGLKFDYIISSENLEGGRKINAYYFSKIIADNAGKLIESNIFNNEPASGTFERNEIDYAYPQPFVYGTTGNYLYLPTSGNESGYAYFNIYSTSMDLVYSGREQIFSSDKITVRWNGKDFNGNRLPTGIYLYVTKSGDTIKKGKILIQNK